MKNIFKSGFTLVELMVFFIFISIVLAASTPIITKRVKNIPLKIHHGKFICTPGHYEYYNSTRLVSSGDGACVFKPPKRNTLYKIELIGAGAGGYDYAKYWEDPPSEKTGTYEINGYSTGDGFREPNEAYLLKIFNNADYRVVKTGTTAGKGQELSETYTSIGNPEVASKVPCSDKGTRTVLAYDDDGEPIMEGAVDKDGNPIMEGVVDDDGNPVMEEKKDKDGNVVKDEDGNPVMVQKQQQKKVQATKKEDYWKMYNKKTGGSSYLGETTEDPGYVSCAVVDKNISNAVNGILALKPCTPFASNFACLTVAGRTITAAAHAAAESNECSLLTFSTDHEVDATSSSQGFGKGLYVDGKINWIDYTDGKNKKIDAKEIKSYLAKIFGTYYQTGSTQAPGSCEGWGYNALNNHYGKFGTTHNLNLNNSGGWKTGKYGYDVIHYDAIRGWGNFCATTSKPATGSEGAQLYFDGDSYVTYTTSTTPGKDAVGVSGSFPSPWQAKWGVKSEVKPYAYFKTALNSRHHRVGHGGGAASKIAVYYASNLSNDCVFSPATGGRPIKDSDSDSVKTELEKGLYTTLTCNEGTMHFSVRGGTYDKGIESGDYSGFDYYNADGTFSNPGSFNTSHAGGQSSFNINDVFTKYVITGTKDWGAGGNGSSISDKCTQPYGWFDTELKYHGKSDTRNIDHHDIPPVKCNAATDVKVTPATSGSNGAIIITW